MEFVLTSAAYDPMMRYSLLAITALLLFSPILHRVYGWRLDVLLIFCGGFANLASLSDICTIFSKTTDRMVRSVFVLQLFIFAIILGGDAYLILSAPVRLVVSVAIIVVLLLTVAIKNRSGTETYVIFGLGIIVAASVVPDAWKFVSDSQLASVVRASLNQTFLSVVETRFHAWVHLLAIPSIYLCVDYIVRNKVPVAKKSLPLDWQVFGVGFACAAAGLAIEKSNGLFEAGSSAAVLLLGNWMYSSYVTEI